MKLTRFSMGLGDRFGFEGAAQLRAIQRALERGVTITPVWNKSNREHSIIGTEPSDTRRATDAVISASGWKGPYLVDADHITSSTVGRFVESSDYFTIDVAESLGKPSDPARVEDFLKAMGPLKGRHEMPGLGEPIVITDALLAAVAVRYLSAVEEAERVYHIIEAAKGPRKFIAEVSLDESEEPQSAAELFLVLGALARAGVAVQTIAPKFGGAFLKGIDFVGDPDSFAAEFAHHLGAVELARRTFGMQPGLKLSIHSGSDKFRLYPVIRRLAGSTGAGFHLKTAGTTWLEEVIGLAAAGGEGLKAAKAIYAAAYARWDELTGPYRSVVSIDRSRLPLPQAVDGWNSTTFVKTLEHEQSRDLYNPHFRQLVHVAFRIAAEMGPAFTGLLRKHRRIIEEHVTDNIFRRHLVPLFFEGEFPPPSRATTARSKNV